jgi:bacteriorhodopsin
MSTYNSDKTIQLPSISSSIPLVPKPPENPPTTTIGATTPKEKIEIKANPVQYYVKASFMITYILLLTTATITFVEAMRVKNDSIRHVLNLETCISIVAGYFYSIFVTQIEGYNKEGKDIDWSDITKTRYVDWTITTPMMILVLCIVLGSHIGVKIGLRALVCLVALNLAMLVFGYLGETKIIDRITANIMGFIPFTLMFYLIYIWFIKPKYVFANSCLFYTYLVLWGLYGVVYLLPETYKNISMNVLDCLAKCFIGLSLWLYYSGTVTIY